MIDTRNIRFKDYNDKLDPDRQISTEEAIAGYLYDFDYEDGNYPNESDCQTLSQDILKLVLAEFRPGLFEK